MLSLGSELFGLDLLGFDAPLESALGLDLLLTEVSDLLDLDGLGSFDCIPVEEENAASSALSDIGDPLGEEYPKRVDFFGNII